MLQREMSSDVSTCRTFLNLPLPTSMPLAMRQAKKDLLDKPSKLNNNFKKVTDIISFSVGKKAAEDGGH